MKSSCTVVTRVYLFLVTVEEYSRKRKSETPPATRCFRDYLNEEFYKDCFKHNITDLETLPGDNQIVLWKDQIMVSDTFITICDYHKYKFVDKFVSKFKSANVCANILSKHPKSKKKVKGGHVITLQMATKLQREEKLFRDGKFVEVFKMKWWKS